MTERRTLSVSEVRFRADDDQTGIVEGIASRFGEVDDFGDTIVRGAFANSLAEHRAANRTTPMLWSHDPGEVIGRWTDIEETADGLMVRGRLNLEVQRAREARALMTAGDLDGLSIGFRVRKATPGPKGTRTVTEIELLEASLVALPAAPRARVTNVKAAPAAGSETEMDNENEAPAGADLTAVKAALDELRTRLDEVEVRAARPAPRVETADAPSAERRAFVNYLRLGNQLPEAEQRILTVSKDPQAGYLAPAEVTIEFIRNLVEFSPVRSRASVRTTSSPSVRYPRRDSITNASWEDELEESQESTMTFGMDEVVIHKMMTFVDLSNELLADSAGQAEAEVRMALAEDFGQKEAVSFVSGSGVKQPEGFMTNAEVLHTVNGHATNLSADKLIDLLYAMPATYRNAAGAAWAMNGRTLAAVRKLKDGQQNYLWQPSYQVGQPEMILGKPVVEMVDMPDIGDGNFPIIYGDFSAYRVIDRSTMAVLSDPYTQARRGVTRIHATRRVGGRVLQAARFRKLKTATS